MVAIRPVLALALPNFSEPGFPFWSPRIGTFIHLYTEALRVGQICSSPILQAPKTVSGVHIEVEPTGAPPFRDIPPTPLRPCSLLVASVPPQRSPVEPVRIGSAQMICAMFG